MKKVLFFILAVATVGLVACGGDGLTEVFLEAGTSGGSSSGSSSSGSSSSGCTCYASNGTTSTFSATEVGSMSCSELADYINSMDWGYTVTCE
ncbi:MAG: hypothetical protein SNI45_03035 [Rikenellaceae bacterium]